MNSILPALRYLMLSALFLNVLVSCKNTKSKIKTNNVLIDSKFTYNNYQATSTDRIISRAGYADKLYGFWLGQCIANWTGLVTEMDKIGNIGDVKTGDFYTRENWDKPDQPSIWGEGVLSNLSENIDFVFRGEDEVWGADDDTDIEYMYQHLLYTHRTGLLTGEQIKDGWLKHMLIEEENFLWVANQKALDLMQKGYVPPATSDPKFTTDSIYDNYYEMIDAQLTTEIFGFYAPARPDFALKMAELPIQTTARKNAQWISEFNVIMYSLAAIRAEKISMKEQIHWMAHNARSHIPNDSYAAKMFDFVKQCYDDGMTWEEARDAVYIRYQVNQEDGYNMTSKNIYCNGCFAGGINFAASIVSLLYGEGDLKETIKIGTLAGWDSDNPTATWGGLLGFMYGKEGVEEAFGRTFSDKFNIHRTRRNFPNGVDNFNNMAKTGVFIVDRVVQDYLGGGIDLEKDVWHVPIQTLESNSTK
ncbi:ADP-ribosylglycohydrolase family protein [Urechidicola vernalis]|uniref:ADP-ribosylglycohydrolase family protein n=1 Tax=Urechidicola vernalis TaxID=3075600 RepID=A0ABU2Y6V6_9FLAO|nr:ADP-ribosylglycohydrolase family protein [Urechidicola sp. P050]MDT0553942.1 ADP-ribosylglycohydrolase family protein [Urechidicola sp. P050]